MPGYLKMGCKSRSIIDRVKELDKATSVPEPFKIEAYVISKNRFLDELEAHRFFDDYRVPKNKNHGKLKKDFNFDYLIDHIVKESGLVPDCFGKRLKNKAMAEKYLSCKHKIPCLNIS